MSTVSSSGSPKAAASEAAAPVEKIVVTDPHIEDTGLSESEVTRIRTLRGFWRWALVTFTLATILLCMNQQFGWRFFIGYTQLNTEYFYLLIGLMLPFTFLIFPGWSKAPLDRIPWYDLALFVITLGASLYLMSFIRAAASNGWEFGGAPKGVYVAGLIMWALLMEALRRAGGWSLLLSVFPFTVYPLFADQTWLGPFRGTQSDLELTTSYHMLSGESLLGIPMQAFADTVIGFLVFGTALMMTGAGKFFINLSFALCGTFRGGAAKVCVFASGLLGTVGGSIVSNVLTAGTMTIPTMKRTGFSPSYAGAIEACASTGAVLAPPVLGATAFVMAQFMNVSYAEVALAATLPSVLYYAGLYMQVDAYAARHKLKGLQRAELPRFWDAFKEGWYYLFVIVILVVMLLHFKRESHAPFYASALLVILHQWSGPAPWKRGNTAVIVVSVLATALMIWYDVGNAVLWGMCVLAALNEFFPGKNWGGERWLTFLELNGKTFVELTAILAGCGLLIGAFSVTGVVSSLANDLLNIAGGDAFLLLIMCAVTSMVLGLGLTATSCYIFLAILVAPALEKLGLNKMAVHMFIFYWGMLSAITPPVAIASFAAAGIAGAPAMKTGWQSMWVGSIIYFIPFFFVLNPALLLQGTNPWAEALALTLLQCFAMSFICGGIQGYQAYVGDLRSAGALEWPIRVLLVIGGFILATPGGGIVPISQAQIMMLGGAILVPTVLLAVILVRRDRARVAVT
jgi:TRAP transporter 4TM/12TM fusion protein